MTRPAESDIDLDDLMQKVRGKVGGRKRQHPPGIDTASPHGEGADSFQRMQTLNGEIAEGLNLIRRHSRVRTELPQVINRFPFNRISLLRKLLLKAYELLFRDQRAVNNAVADTLYKVHRIARESSDILSRVAGMEAALRALETRTNEMISGLQGELTEERRIRSQIERDLQRLAPRDGPADRSEEPRIKSDPRDAAAEAQSRGPDHLEPDS